MSTGKRLALQHGAQAKAGAHTVHQRGGGGRGWWGLGGAHSVLDTHLMFQERKNKRKVLLLKHQTRGRRCHMSGFHVKINKSNVGRDFVL